MVIGMKPSLIPKKNRKLIYESLFKEGVMVVEKNTRLPKHPDIDVPNLHVILALMSLKSRNYVTEKFNWRHHYYVLNNEGVEYLRQYLYLPVNVAPNTYQSKKPIREGRGGGGGGGAGGDGGWRDRDRDGGGGRGRGGGRGYRRDDEEGKEGYRGGRGDRQDWGQSQGGGGAGEWGAQPVEVCGDWGSQPQLGTGGGGQPSDGAWR
eukprot:GHVN01102694.1.p1 GENE.GHVN01102694.1~~GHVN01102694.1.p1  ORF type:complete len:206 (+),score=35.96 GHVN01102694.1:102-719(+)